MFEPSIAKYGNYPEEKDAGAVERDETARAIFREVIAQLKAEDVVVVDESGSRIGRIPLYARAPRGLRAYDRVIRNYGRNITLLASIDLKGMQAAMTVEGAVDEAVFETFVQKVLLPTLRPGQVVIMDNLSSHRTERIEQLITQAGCQLLYYLRIRRISRLSRKPFPSSRRFCAVVAARQSLRSLKQLSADLTTSRPMTPTVGLLILAFRYRLNVSGKRCNVH